MSRYLSQLAACLFASAASVVLVSAQETQEKPYPVFTMDHFVSTMKTVGPNFIGANGLLEEADYEGAKAQFIRTREQLATTVTFWRDRGREDAIGFLREALSGLDALDGTLSASPVDPAEASGHIGRIGAACQACHAVYREQDPTTNEYRLKPGSISQR